MPESRPQISREKNRRMELWERLLQAGGPKGVAPDVLQDLRIYKGQAGIWTDKRHTSPILSREGRLTVSVLQAGGTYSDDISGQELIYKYPNTKRVGRTDQAEIEATKNTARHDLPIFVVSHSERDRKLRDVYWGRVLDWNDEAEEFLIRFTEALDALPSAPDRLGEEEVQEPFKLTADRSDKTSPRPARPGQKQFRFKVKKRYGLKCAVCDQSVEPLLEAIHIRDRSEGGSNDPRNGLLLCRNHHKAFDDGLFGIEPESMELQVPDDGLTLADLGIDRSHLRPKRNQPHVEALRWVWERVEWAD